MKTNHLVTSLIIVACTAICWFILGSALSKRSQLSSSEMHHQVAGVWGPEIEQVHPRAWFETPNAPEGRAQLLPSDSKILVHLDSDPKKRGLVWHRTYKVDFIGEYVFRNPTRIPQTIYIAFPVPRQTEGLDGFTLTLGDQAQDATPDESGVVLKTILLGPEQSISMKTRYRTRGTNHWKYTFDDNRRIAGFRLEMQTDFDEINFPVGTGSPSNRRPTANGYTAVWDYPDTLSAQSIGMDMPKQLNAGPVASRIAFFAPVSLLFFVTVILLIAGLRGIPLHPMHIFFVAAGFFAFHLLFAYLVDLLPLWLSFTLSTLVSISLVCGYLKVVGGKRLLHIALPAQCTYLVAFSASFFIDGLTGITLTVLGIITLALLMFLTAHTDWKSFFTRSQSSPPPLPAHS